VAVDIGHAHHHRLTRPGFWQRFLLAGNDNRTTAKRKLGSVFSYAQPFYESKGATEPIHGFAHISIRKHWDNNAGRHGSVRFHSFLIRLSVICRGARGEIERVDYWGLGIWHRQSPRRRVAASGRLILPLNPFALARITAIRTDPGRRLGNPAARRAGRLLHVSFLELFREVLAAGVRPDERQESPDSTNRE
jgi:hypothetical protein